MQLKKLDRTEYDFDYVNWCYLVGCLLGIAQRKTAQEAKIAQHKQIFEWVQSKKITFQNYIDLNILFPLNNCGEQNSNTENNELKRTY